MLAPLLLKLTAAPAAESVMLKVSYVDSPVELIVKTAPLAEQPGADPVHVPVSRVNV